MGSVRLDGITKRYEDVVAVNDVSVTVEDGEFVTLVGPSGCGKSTTLETIAGLTKPTEGAVHIADREVTTLPPKDRGIAMVFQNIALFPHMDVYDNISFGLRLRSFPKEEIDERVERAAEILQIGELLDRMPDELSGGQRQRVAIGRAIVREPEVFLMDEPLANLDAKLRVHMRTELQRLHRELGTTIIYVTHDQAEAMTMSTRIAVMNAGEIQQLAPPLTCYNEPANRFVAEFIGSPSMNTFEGVVDGDEFVAEQFSVTSDPEVHGLSDGDRITLGIRPENVALVGEEDEPESATEPIVCRTDVIEPMGNEVFVYLVPGGGEAEVTTSRVDQLLMSVDPRADVAADESVAVVFDRTNVHLFDADTGDAIAHGIAPPSSEVRADDVEGRHR